MLVNYCCLIVVHIVHHIIMSAIDIIYKNLSDMELKRASVSVNGVDYGLTDIFKSIISRIPFVKHIPIDLNEEDVENHSSRFYQHLLKCMPSIRHIISNNNKTLADFCFINVMKVSPEPNVCFKSELNMFIIKDINIPAMSKVRVNTGYLITILQNITNADTNRFSASRHLSIENNNHLFVFQRNRILLTNVVLRENNGQGLKLEDSSKYFIPCVFARDPEDTGLFTVLFSTKKELKNAKISIELKAFSTWNPDSSMYSKVNVVNGAEGAAGGGGGGGAIFKGKDIRNTRLTKNLKLKIKFDSMNCSLNEVTFSGLTSTEDGIKFKNLIAPIIFTSRKREWIMPQLHTGPGIYSPSNNNDLNIVPYIANNNDGSLADINTHCINFVNKELVLLSTHVTKNVNICNYRILNGSFFDIPNYKEYNKHIVKVLRSLTNLSDMYKEASELAKKYDLNLHDVIEMFDFNRRITFYYLPQQLKAFKERTDLKRVKAPYSKIIYLGLTYIIDGLILKQQTISANKHRPDDDDDDDDNVNCKKLKVDNDKLDNNIE